MEFKIGDRVKLLRGESGASFVTGLTGVIDNDLGRDYYNWHVKLDDKVMCGYYVYESWIEHTDETQFPEFKVGDRVKLLKGCDGSYAGKTGVIVSQWDGYSKSYDWDVKLDSGYTWLVANGHLEHTAEDQTPTLKLEVGDVCKILCGESKGKTVQLAWGRKSDKDWSVDSIDGSKIKCECCTPLREHGALISSNQLELLVRPKFKVGDVVSVTKSKHFFNSIHDGPLTIKKIGSYVGTEGVWWYVTGKSKYGVTAEEGRWENHLVAYIEPKCPFEIGDLVRRKAGNIGKVIKVDTGFKCVKVEASCNGFSQWLCFTDVEKI